MTHQDSRAGAGLKSSTCRKRTEQGEISGSQGDEREDVSSGMLHRGILVEAESSPR